MEELIKLRKKIDVVDNQLLVILQKRLKIVTQIGKLKKKLGLPPFQPKRWHEVMNSRMKIAEKLGMKKNFIHKLFNLIHNESLQNQNYILKNRDSKT